MRCPICKSPSDSKLRPFCSQRCADIDLGRWLNESYRAPAQADEGEEAQDFEAQDRLH